MKKAYTFYMSVVADPVHGGKIELSKLGKINFYDSVLISMNFALCEKLSLYFFYFDLGYCSLPNYRRVSVSIVLTAIFSIHGEVHIIK